MNVKTAFFLAFNSIKRGNKGTLLMTILIMTLAYVNLVFVSSIFGGIVEAINQQAIDYQYANIVIEPSPDDRYIDNKAMGMIKSIPGVVGSSAHYIDKSVIEYDYDGRFILLGALQMVLFFSIVCIFGGLIGIIIRGITLLIKKYVKNKKK
ncbi:MAG: hypothetical protein WC006_08010 [Bacilli bacterium]